MLYSILSQINKGLRRIPILRKSGITVIQRCFDYQPALIPYSQFYFRTDHTDSQVYYCHTPDK
jgi:hypothetical protein